MEVGDEDLKQAPPVVVEPCAIQVEVEKTKEHSSSLNIDKTDDVDSPKGIPRRETCPASVNIGESQDERDRRPSRLSLGALAQKVRKLSLSRSRGNSTSRRESFEVRALELLTGKIEVEPDLAPSVNGPGEGILSLGEIEEDSEEEESDLPPLASDANGQAKKVGSRASIWKMVGRSKQQSPTAQEARLGVFSVASSSPRRATMQPPKLTLAGRATALGASSMKSLQGQIKKSKRMSAAPWRSGSSLVQRQDSSGESSVGETLSKPEFQQFGVPIDSVPCCKVRGYASEIPAVLVVLRQQLRQFDGLRAEGVFRLSANKEIQAMYKDQLNQGKFAGVEAGDVMCMAALIKEWFRCLPEHLLNCIPRDVIMESSKSQNPSESVPKLLAQIPEPNNSMFLWLLDLLAEAASYESVNRMHSKALAIVLAPNLYSVPENSTPMEMVAMMEAAVKMVQIALDHRIASRSS